MTESCCAVDSSLQVGKFHESNEEPLAIPEGTGDEARLPDFDTGERT